MPLLDGNAFGQVAGLVDVAAAADGDVVGQQLQRHDLQQRQKQLDRGRDGDDVVGDHAGDKVIVFGRDRR